MPKKIFKSQTSSEKFIRLKILSKSEKSTIEKQLKNQFGVSEVPGIIAMRGKERLFLFTGDFSEEKIRELEDLLIVERVGVYFAKEDENIQEVRLSIEGTQILKDQIKENIFELNGEQVEEWMKGHELNIKTGKKGFLVMKYKDNFLGTGKASEEKIGNFIPKNRRLKERG